MSFTGGFLTLSNGTITALGGSNLNLVTSGAGVVQVNGSLIESQGNFNILQTQVALNQSNIGAPNSNVLFPTLYTGLSNALSGGANDSVARANAGNALSGNANDAVARTALSGSANDSVARTSASNAQTTANTALAQAQHVLSKFAVTTNNVGLGAGFTDQASFTITPTIDTAVLNVWGSVTASEAGSDGLLDVRLLINGIPTNFQSVTIPNNHQQTITVFGSGTGGLPGLPVTISVQARESAGTLTKQTATLMCIAQTTLG